MISVRRKSFVSLKRETTILLLQSHSYTKLIKSVVKTVGNLFTIRNLQFPAQCRSMLKIEICKNFYKKNCKSL